MGELLKEAAKIAFSNLKQTLQSCCTVSLGKWRLLHPAQLSPIYLEQALESRSNQADSLRKRDADSFLT